MTQATQEQYAFEEDAAYKTAGLKAETVLRGIHPGTSVALTGTLEGFRLRRRDWFGTFELVPPSRYFHSPIARLSHSEARDAIRLMGPA